MEKLAERMEKIENVISEKYSQTEEENRIQNLVWFTDEKQNLKDDQ